MTPVEYIEEIGGIALSFLNILIRAVSFPFALLLRCLCATGSFAFRYFTYFVCPAAVEKNRYYRTVRNSLSDLKTALRTKPKLFRPLLRYYLRKNRSLYRFRFRYLCYWLAPAAALVLAVAAFRFINGKTLALRVTFNGEPIGFVRSEEEFLSAAQDAAASVGESAGGISTSGIAYQFAYINAAEISSTGELKKQIAKKTPGSLSYACTVYVDGKKFAVAESAAFARSVFDEKLTEKSQGVSGYLICFLQEIEYREGLYPENTVLSQDEFRKKLDGMPSEFLTLKVMQTRVSNVTVPYDTVEIPSNMLYIGSSRKISYGQNGIAQVTKLITYVGGKAVSSEEVSRITVKEAVSEKKQMGTKALDSQYSQARTMGGIFLWPIIGAYGVNSDYGYRWGRLHAGIDLGMGGAAGTSLGKQVVAVAAGKVTTATYHSAYGYYIILDHGNGLSTLYAHLYPNSFTIAAGDTVAAGQPIAKVGSTGNSTGPHLHFEVRINGTKVNPRPYLGI